MGKHPSWSEPPGQSLRVSPGFRLSDVDPGSTPGWDHGKGAAVKEMTRRGKHLATLQEKLFAHAKSAGGTASALLVLQGMDTSGKGGIVSHVVGMVNPQGVAVRGFGVPTDEEKKHHYLWRIENALPSPGKIGVFDRSHYEQVLVVRVHNLVPPEVWSTHYDELNAFEQRVTANGTSLIKCALLVSKGEQLRRLEERLDDPQKYWKYNPKDLDERAHWDDYMDAYQAIFDRCSPADTPWHAIPADHKWYARLAVTELLTTALEGLDLAWPAADFNVKTEKARIATERAT